MSFVTKVVRVTWRSDSSGRSYLTKRAAYQAEARSRLACKCECARGDYVDIGVGLVEIEETASVCRWHMTENDDYIKRVVARWGRMMASADRRRA